MSEAVELIWYGDDAPWYDHGPQHPLRPARVRLTRELILAYGIVDGRSVLETPARDARDEDILKAAEDWRKAGRAVALRLLSATPRVESIDKAPAGASPSAPWREAL